jgi:hypothetical protein
MITTVTTSTVSSVSSVTTVVGISASLAMIAVICLVGFLILKESLSSSVRPMSQILARALNVAIVPLLMAFAMLAVAKAIELFG